jgi:hypothetical protein
VWRSISLSVPAQLSRSGGWRLLWCASPACGRALPRRRAPAVRTAGRRAGRASRVVSRRVLWRVFLGRTPGAHVKVLVSHGLARASLARRWSPAPRVGAQL